MNKDQQFTQRWNTAVQIAISDLEEPHEDIRAIALAAGCYAEFIEVRESLIIDAHDKFTYNK